MLSLERFNEMKTVRLILATVGTHGLILTDFPSFLSV